MIAKNVLIIKMGMCFIETNNVVNVLWIVKTFSQNLLAIKKIKLGVINKWKKLSEIQRNVQCINCINKTFDRCKNNDMYLIRNHCCNYIPKNWEDKE